MKYKTANVAVIPSKVRITSLNRAAKYPKRIPEKITSVKRKSLTSIDFVRLYTINPVNIPRMRNNPIFQL